MNEYDMSPFEIADAEGRVHYCPVCGAPMHRCTEFFDVGEHMESFSYYECPNCG